MNTPDNRAPHDQLAKLVRDAAEGIEPRDGLMAIRTRTTPKEKTMNNVRTWLVTGLGGAVATAAVIGGVWLVTNDGDENSQDPGPADTPTSTVTATPTDDPTGDPGTVDVTVAAYYPGETPRGLRLYREFRVEQAPDSSTDAKLEAAVCTAALAAPDDDDYATYWGEAGLTECSATWNGDFVTIDLGGSINDLHSGAGLSAEERAISVEQLIFTAQGAVGEGRVGVRFLLDGKITNEILGQPASEPLANGPVLDTLSHVNISSPGEGETVFGSLDVTGLSNSFEANVTIELRPAAGGAAVVQTFAMAEGWGDESDKLYAFETTIDLSGVAPGTYVLTVATDDPSGGEEGFGPFTDTKTITVE